MRKKNNKSVKPERMQNKSRSTNDPMWYASDPAILRDAASIPFSWALGTSIDRGGEGTLVFDNDTPIPGICRVDLTPTMGLSLTADSALNTAATAMYSFIRNANSGHANYDAPDLMLYCGAMAQVYSYINWCQRLYGIATLYAQKNRYLPKALLTSMGIDSESITNNLANFRYWINVMVSKASSLAVPATMSYFSRTAFLYSNLYCESESIKDQIYYFHPAAWYKFQWDASTTSGQLTSTKLTPAVTDKLTLSEIQRFGEEMLGVILSDEDMNIMSGDILKAYGIEHIVKLTSIDEYYPVIPVFDPMVLEQIHNATAIRVEDCNVVQDASHAYLTCAPTTTNASDICAITMNKILSVDKAEPGPEDVIESTRLMVAGDSSRSTSNKWYVGCGTEVATAFRIYTINGNKLDTDGYVTISSESEATKFTDVIRHYLMPKYFKYFPHLYIADTITNTIVGRMESVDNYAVLNPADIYKMHDVALMNMLAVPSIAKVNRV